jgi:hypothetical protein
VRLDNLCNENQLDALYILIYFINQPLHVLGTFTAHHQEAFTVYVQQLVGVIHLGDWQLVGSVPSWPGQLPEDAAPTALGILCVCYISGIPNLVQPTDITRMQYTKCHWCSASWRWASNAWNMERPLIINKLNEECITLVFTMLIYYDARSTKHWPFKARIKSHRAMLPDEIFYWGFSFLNRAFR